MKWTFLKFFFKHLVQNFILRTVSEKLMQVIKWGTNSWSTLEICFFSSPSKGKLSHWVSNTTILKCTSKQNKGSVYTVFRFYYSEFYSETRLPQTIINIVASWSTVECKSSEQQCSLGGPVHPQLGGNVGHSHLARNLSHAIRGASV